MILRIALLTVLFIIGSSFAELKNRYFFNPYVGYFIFDKQRNIDNGTGGGINFGYFFTENFGLDILVGFVPTKHFGTDRTIFALSMNFIKIYRKSENRFRPYITFGFGGNRNIGFFWGLNGGIGFKYFFKPELGFDASFRGFYLWNGRFDSIVTAGITYLFR